MAAKHHIPQILMQEENGDERSISFVLQSEQSHVYSDSSIQTSEEELGTQCCSSVEKKVENQEKVKGVPIFKSQLMNELNVRANKNLINKISLRKSNEQSSLRKVSSQISDITLCNIGDCEVGGVEVCQENKNLISHVSNITFQQMKTFYQHLISNKTYLIHSAEEHSVKGTYLNLECGTQVFKSILHRNKGISTIAKDSFYDKGHDSAVMLLENMLYDNRSDDSLSNSQNTIYNSLSPAEISSSKISDAVLIIPKTSYCHKREDVEMFSENLFGGKRNNADVTFLQNLSDDKGEDRVLKLTQHSIEGTLITSTSCGNRSVASLILPQSSSLLKRKYDSVFAQYSFYDKRDDNALILGQSLHDKRNDSVIISHLNSTNIEQCVSKRKKNCLFEIPSCNMSFSKDYNNYISVCDLSPSTSFSSNEQYYRDMGISLKHKDLQEFRNLSNATSISNGEIRANNHSVPTCKGINEGSEVMVGYTPKTEGNNRHTRFFIADILDEQPKETNLDLSLELSSEKSNEYAKAATETYTVNSYKLQEQSSQVTVLAEIKEKFEPSSDLFTNRSGIHSETEQPTNNLIGCLAPEVVRTDDHVICNGDQVVPCTQALGVVNSIVLDHSNLYNTTLQLNMQMMGKANIDTHKNGSNNKNIIIFKNYTKNIHAGRKIIERSSRLHLAIQDSYGSSKNVEEDISGDKKMSENMSSQSVPSKMNSLIELGINSNMDSSKAKMRVLNCKEKTITSPERVVQYLNQTTFSNKLGGTKESNDLDCALSHDFRCSRLTSDGISSNILWTDPGTLNKNLESIPTHRDTVSEENSSVEHKFVDFSNIDDSHNDDLGRVIDLSIKKFNVFTADKSIQTSTATCDQSCQTNLSDDGHLIIKRQPLFDKDNLPSKRSRIMDVINSKGKDSSQTLCTEKTTLLEPFQDKTKKENLVETEILNLTEVYTEFTNLKGMSKYISSSSESLSVPNDNESIVSFRQINYDASLFDDEENIQSGESASYFDTDENRPWNLLVPTPEQEHIEPLLFEGSQPLYVTPKKPTLRVGLSRSAQLKPLHPKVNFS